jgi:hypothetical protein
VNFAWHPHSAANTNQHIYTETGLHGAEHDKTLNHKCKSFREFNTEERTQAVLLIGSHGWTRIDK